MQDNPNTPEQILKDKWAVNHDNVPFDEMYVGHKEAIIEAMKAYSISCQEALREKIASEVSDFPTARVGAKQRILEAIRNTPLITE